MKKILPSLFVIFFTIISYSQSLIVTGDSIVYGHPSVFQLEAALLVKNISSNTAIVFCEKNVIQQNQTGTNDFCWAGQCYSSTTFVSNKTDTINSGGQSDGFTGHYQPWNVADIAMVEYCFYLESDPNDRACATITYNATGLISSNKVTKSEKIGSFYPNPTGQYINFQFNVNINSTLQITDVLGNTVKKVGLDGAGEMSIYLGELHEGVYFANLIENGKIIKIKKIIINK
tara:strand:- start:2379 stop:3071 length:693 start_codon:yes stop_codon:yes gene_type:complete